MAGVIQPQVYQGQGNGAAELMQMLQGSAAAQLQGWASINQSLAEVNKTVNNMKLLRQRETEFGVASWYEMFDRILEMPDVAGDMGAAARIAGVPFMRHLPEMLRWDKATTEDFVTNIGSYISDMEEWRTNYRIAREDGIASSIARLQANRQQAAEREAVDETAAALSDTSSEVPGTIIGQEPLKIPRVPKPEYVGPGAEVPSELSHLPQHVLEGPDTPEPAGYQRSKYLSEMEFIENEVRKYVKPGGKEPDWLGIVNSDPKWGSMYVERIANGEVQMGTSSKLAEENRQSARRFILEGAGNPPPRTSEEKAKQISERISRPSPETDKMVGRERRSSETASETRGFGPAPYPSQGEVVREGQMTPQEFEAFTGEVKRKIKEGTGIELEPMAIVKEVPYVGNTITKDQVDALTADTLKGNTKKLEGYVDYGRALSLDPTDLLGAEKDLIKAGVPEKDANSMTAANFRHRLATSPEPRLTLLDVLRKNLAETKMTEGQIRRRDVDLNKKIKATWDAAVPKPTAEEAKAYMQFYEDAMVGVGPMPAAARAKMTERFGVDYMKTEETRRQFDAVASMEKLQAAMEEEYNSKIAELFGQIPMQMIDNLTKVAVQVLQSVKTADELNTLFNKSPYYKDLMDTYLFLIGGSLGLPMDSTEVISRKGLFNLLKESTSALSIQPGRLLSGAGVEAPKIEGMTKEAREYLGKSQEWLHKGD